MSRTAINADDAATRHIEYLNAETADY